MVAGATKGADAGLTRDMLALSEGASKQAAGVNPNVIFGQLAKEIDAPTKAMVPSVLNAPTAAEAQARFTDFFTGVANQSLAKVDPSLDVALGQSEMAHEVASNSPFTKDPNLLPYLQGIVDKLKTAGKTQFDYKVTLLDSPEINAFNAGGPSMAVYTGILPVMQNEAQFASVLGHEMTHGERRHVVQGEVLGMVSKSAGDNINPQALTPALRSFLAEIKTKFTPDQIADPDFLYKQLPQSDLGKASPKLVDALKMQAVVEATQRSFENQADAGGVRLLQAAGYDPEEAVNAFKNLPASNPDTYHQFLNGLFDDHPQTPDRIAAVQNEINTEHLETGTLNVNQAQYEKAIASVLPATPQAA